MTLPPDLLLHAQLCAGVIAGCWLLSVLTREYSWVDRIWSVVPPVYVGVFAAQA
jgi:steroid 5-alpha reductase family enzyme